MRRIAFFLKVFERESFMEDFLNGKIYMNRLSYFIKPEKAEEDNRADHREALCSIWQPNEVTIDINGYKLTELAGPIESRYENSKYLHAFCLFTGAIAEQNFLNPHGNIPEINEGLRVPESCGKLGEYYVVIHNTENFIERIVQAVKQEGYGKQAQAGMVEYYDPETFSGDFGRRFALYKTQNFSHQKEYRFVIDTKTIGDDPLIVNIGDIRDIASISETWDVNIEINTNSSTKIV
jgi:hypothetical protein